VQNPGDLPRLAAVSGQRRDPAVGNDFSPWNPTDDTPDFPGEGKRIPMFRRFRDSHFSGWGQAVIIEHLNAK